MDQGAGLEPPGIVADKKGWYEGEQLDGKKHGRGMLRYHTGAVYDGEWRKGKYHGFGLYTYPPSTPPLLDETTGATNTATGATVAAEYQGYQQQYYRGEWIGGKRHGHGTYVDRAKGFEYVGQWVSNQRHGYGTLSRADGTRYEGEWQADLKHGNGVNVYADKSSYSGQWERGMRSGFGHHTFYCPEKEEEEGPDQYSNQYSNQHSNHCSKNRALASFYRGFWEKDVMHGKGTRVYASGSIYEGDWQHGKQTGWGKFSTITNHEDLSTTTAAAAAEPTHLSTTYEGEWLDGMKHGEGELANRWSTNAANVEITITFVKGRWDRDTIMESHERREETLNSRRIEGSRSGGGQRRSHRDSTYLFSGKKNQ